jgi:hypothetical protein
MAFIFRDPESGAPLACKTRARLYALCHTINVAGELDSKVPIPILFCGLRSADPGTKLQSRSAASALKSFWENVSSAVSVVTPVSSALGKRVPKPVSPFLSSPVEIVPSDSEYHTHTYTLT